VYGDEEFFVKASQGFCVIVLLILRKEYVMNTKHVLDGQYKLETLRTDGLSESELGKVAEQIKAMYLWFAPDSTDDDIHARLCQHAEAHIDILTHVESGECRGFSVYYTEQINGHRVMFRGGTIVRDRSCGLYKILLLNSISVEEQDFVAAMTQNPRVYETLRSLSSFGVAYPSMGANPPEAVRGIVSALCKVPSIDLDTMIVHDIYNTIRKDADFKKAKDPLVEKFFANSLNENDGFFVVVPLR